MRTKLECSKLTVYGVPEVFSFYIFRAVEGYVRYLHGDEDV